MKRFAGITAGLLVLAAGMIWLGMGELMEMYTDLGVPLSSWSLWMLSSRGIVFAGACLAAAGLILGSLAAAGPKMLKTTVFAGLACLVVSMTVVTLLAGLPMMR